MGLAIVVCALLGCGGGASVKEVSGPNGYPALVIECKELADCLEEAGKSCPRGYDVLMAEREDRPNAAANAAEGYNASIQKRAAVRYTDEIKTLMVGCR
ncbi:MAG: hypothetical protein H6716_17180 [Polyangiaceae bacterium]|nr:hypothetical protein [Polyangiaceae bacterium]